MGLSGQLGKSVVIQQMLQRTPRFDSQEDIVIAFLPQAVILLY
ncbi:MAG: hypothetical protein VX527_03295 [Planctomycetota bacterium]|nr:hypothetical protein [Planctomycetota bacterium]